MGSLGLLVLKEDNHSLLQIKYLENYDVIGTSCSYFGDIENYVPTIPYGDITNHNFLDYNPIINSSVLLKDRLNWFDMDHPWVMYESFMNH